ncbi:MAG: hypothetical protein ABIQ09_17545 [Jatrophihabitantaceae bacterium]
MSADPVNDDERWLEAEVAAGRVADFTARPGADGKLVDIRGVFLRSLALTASRPAGLAVRGIRITGSLDLQLCKLSGPLVLRNCVFDELLDFSKALLVDVNLSGSRLPGLNAPSANIRHDLTLQSVEVTGPTRLDNIVIGGRLSFTGGTFTKPNGNAINADGAHITGDVFCGAGFKAEGEVRLLGATIGGHFALTGGTFTNANANGNAISADITGSVFCKAGFKAEGQVRLLSATIDGHFALTGGTFTNPNGNAINAERATIGTLVLSNKKSEGRIVLLGAHTGYLADDLSSWRQFASASLLDFTYDRIITHGWSTENRLLWLQRDPKYRAQPYEQLAQTLRAQGHEREAREVMVAKNRRRRKQQSWYRQIPEYVFDWLLVYGYHPLLRTLPALILLYALGVFIFFSAQHNHAIIATRAAIHQSATTSGTTAGGVATSPPTAGEQRPVTATATCPPDYPCFSPWAFTADALIPLVNTHQTDFWTVSGSTQAGRWAIHYSWLASALGWLLTTAAALGFTGLIRRD